MGRHSTPLKLPSNSFSFHPHPWGNDPIWNIFEMGRFNHQLVVCCWQSLFTQAVELDMLLMTWPTTKGCVCFNLSATLGKISSRKKFDIHNHSSWTCVINGTCMNWRWSFFWTHGFLFPRSQEGILFHPMWTSVYLTYVGCLHVDLYMWILFPLNPPMKLWNFKIKLNVVLWEPHPINIEFPKVYGFLEELLLEVFYYSNGHTKHCWM